MNSLIAVFRSSIVTPAKVVAGDAGERNRTAACSFAAVPRGDRDQYADPHRTRARTRLAELRLWRGLTQEHMVAFTGLSYNTYVELERGNLPNPRIAQLANCALVLQVPLECVIEPAWREWHEFKDDAPEPPAVTLGGDAELRPPWLPDDVQ